MEKRRGEVLFSRLQSGGPTLASNPAPSTLFQSAVFPLDSLAGGRASLSN